MVANKTVIISTSLIATLKEHIITWKYPPEHRLIEEALCREFGVSRRPVREALRRNIEDGRNIVGNCIKQALARACAGA